MAVFRVERTGDYTVMSNYHLRDRRLSLKAKGLLSQMLSLPEDWDYTLSGLSHINRESRDAIRTAVVELESAGYVIRRQTTGVGGRCGGNEYTIYERPKPVPGEPLPDFPIADKPSAEDPAQSNTEKSKKDPPSKDSTNIASLPFFSGRPEKPKRREAMTEERMERCRKRIRENIDYDVLRLQSPAYEQDLDEIVELMAETVCTDKDMIRVAGSLFPQGVVKARLLKLTGEHIGYVMDCMKENTTRVRNMKQYLLTALFNAPTTISNYYAAQVSHDLYGKP